MDDVRNLWRFVAALVAVLLSALPTLAQEAPTVPAGPLTLEQVLDLAEARSESVGIARTGVTRAEGEQMRARSGRYPQLNASAAYDRALASEFSGVFGGGASGPPCAPFTLDPSAALPDRVAEIERAIDCGALTGSLFGGGSGDEAVDLPFGRKNTWRVSLLFSQSVYSGGRIGAQTDIAAAGRTSAELNLTAALARQKFDVTQAFFDLALTERLVQIAEATVAQAEATVRQVQAGFEAGAQPEFELLRARVTRDNQRPAVIRNRANRDIAMLRLKQLLDLPPDYNLQIVAPLDGPVPPPSAFAARVEAVQGQTFAEMLSPEATAQRTPVREAATTVRLREASLRGALAERRPSVSVTSNYSNVAYPSGLFPTGNIRTNWTVGASLDFPVLTGGRQKGSERVARAELEQSRLQLRLTEELALLDARAAQAELTAAMAAFEASAGTVGQAMRAYQIAEVRFQSGVSTQLELADARLLLQQAEANQAQAARDLQVARARVALLPDLPLNVSSGNTTAPPASGGGGGIE
ncbi:MAG: TolC family protein [Acidobacteriota bacterium]|nr:TolC family protein [Acidobacteriota bacterium]MDQ3421070.1 TolC family protein [Acidobacteriota bacterium]